MLKQLRKRLAAALLRVDQDTLDRRLSNNPLSPEELTKLLGIRPVTMKMARIIERSGGDPIAWALKELELTLDDIDAYTEWERKTNEQKLAELTEQLDPKSLTQFLAYTLQHYHSKDEDFYAKWKEDNWVKNLADLHETTAVMAREMRPDKPIKKEWQLHFYEVAIKAYLTAYSMLYGRKKN